MSKACEKCGQPITPLPPPGCIICGALECCRYCCWEEYLWRVKEER